VRERVSRGECGEGEGGSDGLLEASGIAEGAHQAMMRLNVGGVGVDGGTKALGSGGGVGCCEKIEALLGERVGSG